MEYAIPRVLSEEELKSIEVIVSEGLQVHCEIHPEVDLLDDHLRASGFVSYALREDFRPRRPYERSMWVRRLDGRCVPELYALAALKFGVLSRDTSARWVDGHWMNKLLENVGVLHLGPSPFIDQRVARNKFGVQAGTPEYRRKYYQDPVNRAKQREQARKSAAKQRAILKRARRMLPQEEVLELTQKVMGLQDGRKGDQDDRVFQKLNDPQIQIEIIELARSLQDLTGIAQDDALRQARDQVLGFATPVFIESNESS